jgi:hypothetical protein
LTERHQLTAEHLTLWREGCELLAAMTPKEYREMRGERWDRFAQIDKALTWGLIGPWSASVFDAELDGPCGQRLEMCQSVDWPNSQAWRRALIEASGLTPEPSDVSKRS